MKRVNSKFFTILIIAILATESVTVFGECPTPLYEWIGGSDDWSTPENWSHRVWVWDPCTAECILSPEQLPGTPSLGNQVVIRNGGSVMITGAANAGKIDFAPALVTIQGGTFNATGQTTVNASGQVTLNNGSFSAQEEQIGATGKGAFIQNGGTNVSYEYIIIGNVSDSNGIYELRNGQVFADSESIGHEGIGKFVQTDGNNITLGLFSVGVFSGSDGQYQLNGGYLSAKKEQIGGMGYGIFKQNGGINDSLEYIIIGNGPDSNGIYELRNGQVFADSESIGQVGVGTFVQTGGTNIIIDLFSLGVFSGSDGQYQLDVGPVSAKQEQIGVMGNGTFVQNGGTNALQEYMLVGNEPNSNGIYELRDGQVSADSETIGRKGTGTFVQTGGTNSITNDLTLGSEPGSQGRYDLLGGTLTAGHVEVASEGTGTFVMNGGTINGSTEDSEIFVNSNRGSLTGPGTFNIKVIYDKIYGTDWNQGVILLFDPNCLSSGGFYDVRWTTPDDFAGGAAHNLLPSSVFNISFDGSHCGQFTIAIPYNENEVSYYDASESELLVLQETGPETYKKIADVEIDTENNIIFADCDSFGKYAIAVPPQYHGGGGGGSLCPPWYLGNLDHDCDIDYEDLALLAKYWLKDEPSADIAPIGGDGRVNMQDLAILASNWMMGI